MLETGNPTIISKCIMRVRYSLLFLMIVFLLVAPTPVKAISTVYYVDNTNASCSDAGSGTHPPCPSAPLAKPLV